MQCNFDQCFRAFNILTVNKSSGTWVFRHLTNADLSSLKFEKQITSEVQTQVFLGI